uniref:hypothetical protein n=1 Tax=Roseburia hominis TaxID=301301 RepID=UPI0040384471
METAAASLAAVTTADAITIAAASGLSLFFCSAVETAAALVASAANTRWGLL